MKIVETALLAAICFECSGSFGALSIMASPFSDEGSSVRIYDTSELSDVLSDEKHVCRVEIYGTNVVFLADHKIFQHLETVNLCASQNSSTVVVLSKSHPHIENLTISQAEPLAADAVKSLKCFSNLQVLEIDCPLDAETVGCLELPKSLRILHLKQALQCGSLPNLVNLVFADCAVNRLLIESFRAPHLEVLDVKKSNVSDDVILSLRTFPKLKAVFLPAQFKCFRKEIGVETKANLFITGEPYPSFERHPTLLGPLK